jgi:beta-lactamase regulating signal transducer with metallopeptidase domain
MTRATILLVIVVFLVGPVRAWLLRVQWTRLAPRAAIALWQALAVAAGVALISLCVLLTRIAPTANNRRRAVTDFSAGREASHSIGSLPSNGIPVLIAAIVVGTLVIGAFVLRAVGLMRSAARHRALLDLTAVEIAEAPGTIVLEHPRAVAYSVAGLRPRIVVSRGTVEALSESELSAVLAHERAHLRARHDLVLFPFRCFTSVVPRSRVLATVRDEVWALVEMAADDRAMRQCGSQVLAQAICRMVAISVDNEESGAPVPPAHSPATDRRSRALVARVERVVSVHQNSRLAAISIGFSAVAVLALPAIGLRLPLPGW